MSSSYNYLDTPNVNLLCCICRSPFLDPCTTRTCCHTFCYDCIAQAIAINRQCPIDRTPLSAHDLIPADPVIRNLVDELLVRCPQESYGCSYSCQRLLLPVHVADSCQYVQINCPNPSCAQRILRKDVKQHRCPDTDSNESLASPESPKDDCQETDVASSTPPPNPTSSTESQSVDLAAENAMLRLRLSALESVIHTLRSEMFAVKHALGPWYRPDVDTPLHPEQHSSELEASSEAFERQLAEELFTQTPSSTSETASATARDPTDIASYFPPAEDSSPQMSPRQNRHRSTSSIPHILPPSSTHTQSHMSMSPVSGSYQAPFPNPSPNALYAPSSFSATPGPTPNLSYSQGTSYAASSSNVISIPPLDPTTPLPDTLTTLHSSLGTLAGALGALAATRGAESLRTTEELRGLRGAMHGLRMQVHDILTSRTHLAGPGSTPGGSGTGSGDNNESAMFGMGMGTGTPGWLGYGPRPYPGMLPMHPPPPFGPSHAPPPTNITKL